MAALVCHGVAHPLPRPADRRHRERRRLGGAVPRTTSPTSTGRCRRRSTRTRSRRSSATSASARSTRTTSAASSTRIGADHVLFGSDYPHPEGLAEPVQLRRPPARRAARGRRGRDHGRQPRPAHAGRRRRRRLTSRLRVDTAAGESNHMDLNGRSALVTGGAGGLGGATVRHLVELGVGVAIFDRDADRGADAGQGARRRRASRSAGDVNDDDDVAAAIEAARVGRHALARRERGRRRRRRRPHRRPRRHAARQGRLRRHDGDERLRHLQRDPPRGRGHGRQRARRARPARRGRQHGVDRRHRGPDRPARLRRGQGRDPRHDAAAGPRPGAARASGCAPSPPARWARRSC